MLRCHTWTLRARLTAPTTTHNAAVAKNTAAVYENPLYARLGGGPDDVAKVIEKAIMSDKPKTRYPVTVSAYAFMGQRKLMTDRMWDAFVRTSVLGAWQRGLAASSGKARLLVGG